MIDRRGVLRSLGYALAVMPFNPAWADGNEFTLGATTTTRDSGLLEFLLERFAGGDVHLIRTVVRGSGEVLELGRRGDFDVLLVHDPKAEEEFVSQGHALSRRTVMTNSFVIVGPDDVSLGADASAPLDVLSEIRSRGLPFISRGDNSGTHRAELALWQDNGVSPAEFAPWYRNAGNGMGATLNMATGLGAFTLSDIASWEAFGNRTGMEIKARDDAALENRYSVLVTRTGTSAGGGTAFADWLVSRDGQQAIGEFRVNGVQVFFPAETE